MAELSEVGIASGVPNSGTGEVPTLVPVRDQLISANNLLELIEAVVAAVKDATSNAFKSLLVDGTGAALAVDSTVRIEGNLPHGDADTTPFPMGIGGKSIAALSGLTLETAGDRVGASFDLDGALITRNGGAIGDRVSAVATNTDGTSTACIAAQAAGIKVNLTDVTLSNSHATQFCTVEIKDGTTVKWTFPVPPVGGVTHRFETPLTGTAATAWNFDPSAATTTITCSMSGRLSKV